jgi:hypothetical protein
VAPLPPATAGGPPDGSSARRSRKGWIVALTIVVILLMIAVTFAAISMSGDDEVTTAPGTIRLDAASSRGPDPFTADGAEHYDAEDIARLAPADRGQPGTDSDLDKALTRTGTQPGLYAGAQGEPSCDREALDRALRQDGAKRGAWASAEGIAASDVSEYLQRLTSGVLIEDTRVTNHTYRDGSATEVQSVLQAGTAVLIDRRGVPRVRCASGSPLTPPLDQGNDAGFDGDPWPDFDGGVSAITPGEPIDVFVLVDIGSRRPFSRPAGTEGERDQPITATTTTTETTTTTSSTTTSTSTTTTTTSTTTTTAPPRPTDITDAGAVSASSTWSGDYPADLAVDGDPTTSWFSQGPEVDPDGSVFTWRADGPEQIEEIVITGNGRHPELAEGFGFESVRIEVLAGDAVVFSESVGLPGTPDPTVTSRPGVTGDTVRLTFTGHEDPESGGFAELVVVALR